MYTIILYATFYFSHKAQKASERTSEMKIEMDKRVWRNDQQKLRGGDGSGSTSNSRNKHGTFSILR